MANVMHSEIRKITPITRNIFISGILPLRESAELLSKYKIKYILCCVDPKNIIQVYEKLFETNPDLMVLYLPYNDDLNQNLWMPNNQKIKLARRAKTRDEYQNMRQQLEIYQNRPLIEIAYNFINQVVSNDQRVLVHCMAGMSRSVSMVTYFLMKKHHLSFDSSFNYIKKQRAIANPNDSFQLQLRNYQKMREKFTRNHAAMFTRINQNLKSKKLT